MPKIDIKFLLAGKQIPADHGYYLFSALAKITPYLHNNNETGVHPITGQLVGNRLLNITEHSFLAIRLPAEFAGQVIALAGKVLDIGGYKIRVGLPNTSAIVPATTLYSRLVVIKGFTEPAEFLQAAQRQIDKLQIKAEPLLIEQTHIANLNKDKKTGSRSPYLRRTIKISGKEIVGFALKIKNLTDKEAVLLQENGIGGRRRFGCGIFMPVRN